MSNIPASKRSHALALVAFALLLGTTAGAGAVLWLWKGGPSASSITSLIMGPMSTAEAADASTGPCNGKPAKFYRNPMGAPDTSPVPKKDSMGMDYIAVCEDADAPQDSSIVKVSLDRVQRLGVRSAAVEERPLARVVRSFASVQYDERRQVVVAPKFGGWIEKLFVNATGDVVTAGQPLFEVYSQELNVLQQEWALAGRSGYASDKLRNLDYPEREMERLRRGERPRTVSIPSPAAGTVVEKMAVEGMRFRPGETLFRIVDTRTMWVLAEVYEQDLGFVKVGDTARVAVNAWPDRPFEGKVAFIYPNVGKDSRTARLRIEVANPDGLLRADMAATVEIEAPLGRALAVPESAVIDSGRRQVVLVERGEGRYQPVAVKLGARVPGYVQVLEGLAPADRVVTSATFLIDAESNLRAALASFAAGEGK
ncbi:MAG: efflux RND transporter periplasmic adaptor subunit [Hyphomicrobiaceae bacterium]